MSRGNLIYSGSQLEAAMLHPGSRTTVLAVAETNLRDLLRLELDFRADIGFNST